jgi:hypothetical protein
LGFMDRKERIEALVSFKDTLLGAAAVGLFAMVWGATMTARSASAGLVIAVLLAAAAVFFNRRLADDPVWLRTVWSLFLGGAAAVFSYYIIWLPQFGESGASATTGKLDLRYLGRPIKVPIADDAFGDTHAVIIQDARFVNQSTRNMSLQFILMVGLHKKNGEFTGCAVDGTWQEGNFNKSSARFETLNLDRETTAHGTLFFKLTNPMHVKDVDVDWEKVGWDRMRLRIEDWVSGEFVMCDVIHYPPKNTFEELKANPPQESVIAVE